MSWLSYSSLVPPNLFILLAMIGALVAWRRKPFGLAVATAAIGLLYLVAMPVTAGLLIRWAEAIACDEPTLPSDQPPGAIIVLSADARRSGIIGVPDTVGQLSLERVAEAARQQRRLGLPILVSGGGPPGASLASLMSRVLQEDFRVPVQWREERSQNTFENALYSAEILRDAGVHAALVIAHPWDMARALWSFRAVGYPVVPSPTTEGGSPPLSIAAFLPQIPALLESYYALHELIGLAWYRVRYGHG
ncbi:MAG TPA: YdcF family protein [Stellaceae bacterium]|nr:YdcF family protein [Stellaceae bacterium]